MNKKFYILLIIFIAVLSGGYFINKKFSNNSFPVLMPSPSITVSPALSPSVSPTEVPLSQEKAIPNSYLIKNFPFQSQAPFANWDETHDEACEEASVILVEFFKNGKTTISPQTMDDEILKMVSWEVKNWGTHKDLTVKETAQMAESFYGLRLEEKFNITIEDIKKEISENHPVILPTAGRLLGNPYFRQPGPIYHMVVAIGYSGNTIIVQDVGTRRGENYKYNENILFNAIHDWTGVPENINSGPKNMLVFE